jgi:hypothetical protein
VTADKDFGELMFRQRRLTLGVVLVRLAGLSPTSKAETVASAINKHVAGLPQAFAVITPGAMRIRRQREQEALWVGTDGRRRRAGRTPLKKDRPNGYCPPHPSPLPRRGEGILPMPIPGWEGEVVERLHE